MAFYLVREVLQPLQNPDKAYKNNEWWLKMAVINDKRCKVCVSEHRNEIEKMLTEGISARRISEYIQNKYNETISHNSINTHKKKHWNIEKEVQRVAIEKESEELFHEKVREGLTRLDALKKERNKNQEMSDRLRILINKIIDQILEYYEGKRKKLDINPELFKAIQSLYNTTTSGVRYNASEEYRQLDGGDEDDPFKDLINALGNLEGEENEEAN